MLLTIIFEIQRQEYQRQRQSEMDAFMEIMAELNEFKEQHEFYEIWEEGKEYLDSTFEWDVKEEVLEEELEVKETPC